MANENTRLTREELYRRVWAMPAVRLAEELGISDVALGKLCKKLDVPKPGPGYWAKVEFGARVPPPPPLPPAKKGTPAAATINPTPPAPPPAPELEARLLSEGRPENRITVPADMHGAHPLTRQADQALGRLRSRDPDVRLAAITQPRLDVRVSKDMARRALRIFDALIKALEKRGYAVETSGGDGGAATHVVMGDERVRVRLWEKDDRAERELTASEKKKPPHLITDRWVYTPSGKLTFTIEENWDGCRRKNWADKEGSPLEEQLNEVVMGLLSAAEGLRRQRLQREEWQRRWREEERLRKEAEWRRARLEAEAEKWIRSRNLRAYLEACKRFVGEQPDGTLPDGVTAEWLRWAESYVGRLDPLENGEFEKTLREVNGEHGYF